jgi:ATP-dependent RNA helicase DeaD
VATPGRLIDLIQRKAINLKETITILDEDWQKWSVSTKESLEWEIIVELPKDHEQYCFFSATMQDY